MQIIYKKCAHCGCKFTGDYDWTRYAFRKKDKFCCSWECFKKFKEARQQNKIWG